MRRMFRVWARSNPRRADGAPVIALGLRIGYWPCLKAPFVQVSFLAWRVEIWHGYESAERMARGE